MNVEHGSSQYSDHYEKVSNTLSGQSLAWVGVLRKKAEEQFSIQGFPSLRDEEWRYTNVSPIGKKLFAPAQQVDLEPVQRDNIKGHLIEDAWNIVLVDGHFSECLSQLEGVPELVKIMSMSAAFEQHGELLESYLSSAVESAEHGFVAFNTAWFSEGVFIHIPAQARLIKPIQILHVVTQANFMVNTRNIIVVDELAEIQIIETFVGCDEAYCTTTVMEVFIGQSASLSLYKLQKEGAKAYHFGGCYVQQARDSRFTHHNFSFGGLLVRNDIHTDLDRGSECDLNGLAIGEKRQHIDNHTRINHLQPHAVSRELYKSILNQRARSIFQGRVLVAEDAQKTDSDMHNHNLLLSDDAEADTKPQLEIYADDVKCAHGVTVGQLDQKSIFYLQSRCIDEVTARNILTFAFANEMVEKVKLKSLHDNILEQLLLRFPQVGIEKSWL